MFVVFEVYSGKMIRTTQTEYAANLHCAFNPGHDYLSVDDIFADMLRGNESLESLMSF